MARAMARHARDAPPPPWSMCCSSCLACIAAIHLTLGTQARFPHASPPHSQPDTRGWVPACAGARPAGSSHPRWLKPTAHCKSRARPLRWCLCQWTRRRSSLMWVLGCGVRLQPQPQACSGGAGLCVACRRVCGHCMLGKAALKAWQGDPAHGLALLPLLPSHPSNPTHRSISNPCPGWRSPLPMTSCATC